MLNSFLFSIGCSTFRVHSYILIPTYDIRQHFVGFDSAKWDLVNSTMDNSGESIQYVLYLNDILESGDSFSVFTGVEIPEAMTQEHASHFDDDGVWGFTIDVKAQAVQTENVGANAFAAFQTVGMAINHRQHQRKSGL